LLIIHSGVISAAENICTELDEIVNVSDNSLNKLVDQSIVSLLWLFCIKCKNFAFRRCFM